MKCNLSDICDLITESVSYEHVRFNEYISTENMIQDKGGIKPPSSVPVTGSVRKYQNGDVLVSNIRPYFKKIWYADKEGTCSNDILIFRAKKFCRSYFLYCILSNDLFFQYMTSTSKGTKMPRGDQNAIMKYPLSLPDINTQYKVEKIIQSIDNLISHNSKINDYLDI